MVVHGPYPVGEPRVAREVAVATAAGWGVDVVCLQSGSHEPAREVVGGTRILRLPIRHARGVGAVRVVAEYVGFTLVAALLVLREHVRRPYGVIQVHNPPDFLIAAALLPRLLGAKVVFDVHDLSSDMFAMRFSSAPSILVAVLRQMERLALRLADAVVTVHEPYRDELASRGARRESAYVVMNSVDTALLPESRDIAFDPFRIVYHGTVTPNYGVDLVVDAVARLTGEIPSIRFDVFGAGDAAVAVMRQASELGVADRVQITGRYRPHAEVLQAVAGASVGVIPNLPLPINRFALSSKLFEYVALGIPVVSARLPTIEAHFGDALFYFSPGDALSLAEALRAVARDPERALECAALARVRARPYAWEVSARRYIGMLDDLVESGR